MESKALLEIIQKKVDKGIEQYTTHYLLGTEEASEEIYEACKLYVKIRLPRAAKGNTACITQNSLLVTYTLVQFAIKEYKGVQFWQEFYTSLGFEEDLGATAYRALGEAISICMQRNKLYFYRTSERNMYRDTLLIHALLPQYMVERLYDLLEDIYYKDLEEDYIEIEVEELFNYLSNVFRHYIDMDDMTFTIQGKKMTIANQQLPKAFRIAWIQSPEIIKSLFKRVMGDIDAAHYAKEVCYHDEDRFDRAFEMWRLKPREHSSSTRGPRYLKIRGKKKFTKAQYQLEEGILNLLIPRQVVDVEHIGVSIQLELYNEKGIVGYYPLEVSGRICFKTEEVKIELGKFENLLAYRICAGKTVLYDSHNLLHRDYLLFDESGEEITGKQVGEEKIQVVTSVYDTVETDDVDTFKEEKQGYIIHTMYLNENSYVYIGDKVLTTSSANENTSLQPKLKYSAAYIEHEGDTYSIYFKRPKLKVRLPYKRAVEDIIVSINDKHYNLIEVGEVEVRKLFDGSGDHIVTVYMHPQIMVVGSLYNLIVRIKGTNRKLLEERFVIIEDFKCVFEKQLYYEEQEVTLCNIEGKNLVSVGIDTFPCTFSTPKDGIKKLIVEVGRKRYELYIRIPKLEWRLGNKCSGDLNSQFIWYEDLEDAKQLIVKTPIKPTMALLITDERMYKLEGKSTSEGYSYGIYNELQTNTRGRITLGLMYEGEQYPVTNIYYQPAIEAFDIRYYIYSDILKGLQCFWNFLGKGDVWVDIVYCKTNQLIKTYHVTNGKPLYDPDVELYFGKHQVTIYQLVEDEFFDEEAEKVILLDQSFIVGDVFLNYTNKKTLKITRCLGDDDGIYGVPNFYLKHIAYDRKSRQYTGEGCFETSGYTGNKLLYMTHYNPLYIEVIDMENLRLRIVDRNREALIYDKQTGYINPKEEPNRYDRYVLIEEVEGVI